MFSLGYLPSAERLTVVILKARNLRAVDDSKNTSGIDHLCLVILHTIHPLIYLRYPISTRSAIAACNVGPTVP